MIHRRKILSVLVRDPPMAIPETLAEIRRFGYSTGEICFILNVPRGTLRSWEIEGCRPNIDDGDAIRKLLQFCRNSVTKELQSA